MGETALAVAGYDASSDALEDVSDLAIPVLQKIFAFDYFGLTGKLWSTFVLVADKNETTSCIWLLIFSSLFMLTCTTYEKEKNSFLQYMRGAPLTESTDHRLNYRRLRL